MTETPDIVHGRLLESVHLSGYSFERACSELEFLLDEDRWKKLGAGFNDVNTFLATIDFSGFRIAVEQRKRIAEKLKKIEASQRATAKMLGVSPATINGDLVQNRTKDEPATPANSGGAVQNQTKKWFQDPKADPAKLAKGKERQALKNERRAEREEQLSNKILALPEKRYGVLHPDFPWKFTVYSEETGRDRSAENHYPTMTLDEIMAFDLAALAAPACTTFTWATTPFLMLAGKLLECNGFTYKSSFVWRKLRTGKGRGTGYWVTDEHETLLIATKGNVPAPVQGTQYPSVIEAPVGRHSEKPDIFYEIIESYFPNMPKLELFARSKRPGWDSWGNEVSEEEEA